MKTVCVYPASASRPASAMLAVSLSGESWHEVEMLGRYIRSGKQRWKLERKGAWTAECEFSNHASPDAPLFS